MLIFSNSAEKEEKKSGRYVKYFWYSIRNMLRPSAVAFDSFPNHIFVVAATFRNEILENERSHPTYAFHIFFFVECRKRKKNLLINGTLVTHHALLQKYMHFICYRNENLNQWKCSLSTSRYAYGKNDNDVLAEKTQKKKTDFVKIAMLFFFSGAKTVFYSYHREKNKKSFKTTTI